MNISNQPHNTFDKSEVEAVCSKIQANDDEWTYKVRHDPKGIGRSVIDVYDEDGEFISMM